MLKRALSSIYRHLKNPWLVLLLFVFLSGYLIGRIVSGVSLYSDQPLRVVSDTGQTGVPTVHIEGIYNGELTGALKGNVRFILGDEPISPRSDGTFAVSPDALLSNLVDVLVPEGMHYVASMRGSKYYPVTSAQGARLTPKNRVYFRTGEEAQRAGYRM